MELHRSCPATGLAPWLRGRALILVALLAGALSLRAAPLRAQGDVGWIEVTAPRAWSDNRMLSAPFGATIRIVGEAFHSSGIQSITVGGEPAELRPGADGVVHFELTLLVPTDVPSVSIVATPTVGEPLGRRFRVRVLGAPPTQTTAAASFSPAGAAVLSLVIPGVGQMYTGRPLAGILFLGAGAGVAATGVFYKTWTVRCLSPLSNGTCPPGEELARTEKTPYLVAGLGAAGAIALIAAVEAYAGAKRINSQSEARTAAVSAWLAHAGPSIGVSRQGLTLGIRLTR